MKMLAIFLCVFGSVALARPPTAHDGASPSGASHGSISDDPSGRVAVDDIMYVADLLPHEWTGGDISFACLPKGLPSSFGNSAAQIQARDGSTDCCYSTTDFTTIGHLSLVSFFHGSCCLTSDLFHLSSAKRSYPLTPFYHHYHS